MSGRCSIYWKYAVKKKGVNNMNYMIRDIDDMIYGDSDWSPSER